MTALLTIVMIVKDEAHAIEETLSSLARAGINQMLILDTGSTDNTVQVTKDFFTAYQVTGYVYQEDFIDFSSSRNRALILAEKTFPHTEFLLMPDAEWQLQHPETCITFCEKETSSNTPLYLIKIKMNGLEFTTARLFRASAKIRFKGAVHEAPTLHTTTQVPDPVYFEVKASRYGKEKSKKRWRRDAELLLKEYQTTPDDPRTVFYLAQTYECLGELEKAYQYYQIRAKLNGWDEENYITLLRLGNLAQQINQQDSTIRWSTAMDYFLKAYSLRPHRIEPLVKIADYYWPNNIPTCYLFIRQTYDMPYPHQDILFIEKTMYDYTRYEIISRCAWYLGEYQLGKAATILALKARPEADHLHRNLTLYQDKINNLG